MIKNEVRIAEAIKQAMSDQNIGVNELAKACGISKNSLYKVLRAQTYGIRLLTSILEELNLEIDIIPKK